VMVSLLVLITVRLELLTTARLVWPRQTWSCRPPWLNFGMSHEFRWKLQNRRAEGFCAICTDTCGAARLGSTSLTTRDHVSSTLVIVGPPSPARDRPVQAIARTAAAKTPARTTPRRPGKRDENRFMCLSFRGFGGSPSA